MRNGVIAAGVLALGLLGSACGEGSKTTPESQGAGGPYGQPSSPAATVSPPAASPTETGAVSPSESPSVSPSVSPSESAMPSAGAVAVKAKKVSVGTILVDGHDRTLYIFQKDKGQGGKSACDTACAKEWPPLVAATAPTAGPGVKSSMLTTMTRADGSKQVVYNGWPLYYYDQDKAPGDMKGQGVTSFGAPWYVVSAETGEPITKK